MINVKVLKPQFVKKRVISPEYIRAKFLREDVSIRCNMFNDERAPSLFLFGTGKEMILRLRKTWSEGMSKWTSKKTAQQKKMPDIKVINKNKEETETSSEEEAKTILKGKEQWIDCSLACL